MLLSRFNIKKGVLLVSIVLSTHLENNASAALNNKQLVIESGVTVVVGESLPVTHKAKIRTTKRSLTSYITRTLMVAQIARYKRRLARNGKNSIGKLAIMVLLFLLTALLIFAIAYGGASGGVLILAGAVAIGLLVWLGIQMFKPKRKKEVILV